jgi:hypothetical protein
MRRPVAARPDPTRECEISNGRLLHQASGDLRASRHEMMLALLGRMRLTALEAQAGVLSTEERDSLWRKAEGSGVRLVALEARRHREELAAVG